MRNYRKIRYQPFQKQRFMVIWFRRNKMGKSSRSKNITFIKFFFVEKNGRCCSMKQNPSFFEVTAVFIIMRFNGKLIVHTLKWWISTIGWRLWMNTHFIIAICTSSFYGRAWNEWKNQQKLFFQKKCVFFIRPKINDSSPFTHCVCNVVNFIFQIFIFNYHQRAK